MTTEQRLLKENQELFIRKRTEQEMKIDAWAKRLAEVKDEDVLSELMLPEEISLRVLVPELYKEKPDAEIYAKQHEELCELIDRVNSVTDKYNKEALECLSRFQQLNSSQQ